ncbi:hypothetical protein GCM10010245_67430 [Streptomyces spectabilis]|nr:hypothetical protein GCM10010245_67430 [Streptomyces spectabilis]
MAERGEQVLVCGVDAVRQTARVLVGTGGAGRQLLAVVGHGLSPEAGGGVLECSGRLEREVGEHAESHRDFLYRDYSHPPSD